MKNAEYVKLESVIKIFESLPGYGLACAAIRDLPRIEVNSFGDYLDCKPTELSTAKELIENQLALLFSSGKYVHYDIINAENSQDGEKLCRVVYRFMLAENCKTD